LCLRSPREENPTDQDAVVVLARSSQEAIVVNVADLVTGSAPASDA
jgi:hypothetical protein